MRYATMALLMAILTMTGCATTAPTPPVTGFVAREVRVDGRSHRYQVFVPDRAVAGARPATILFLHGSGERGDDGVKPTQSGLGPYVRAHAATFPAIVVFPQVPEDEEWYGASRTVALAALEAATREFGGDSDRTYLTGLSMGGYGVWEFAMRTPQRFAALVPICGGLTRINDERALYVTEVVDDPHPYATVAAKLRGVPIWMFHGAKDDAVLPDDDRKLKTAFDAVHAPDARYTEFPDANHNAWDPAYATPALWTWLFAQKRR